MFFLLYKHTDDGVFDDFPKISDHFPKISKIFQNCFEGQTNVPEHFREFQEISEEISEDFRGRPEDVSMTHQRFKRQLDISEIIDIFTYVKISYLHMGDIVSFIPLTFI